MNRFAITALAAALLAPAVQADTYVDGYFRADGTYVPGHYRSSPDANRYNNYGSQTYGGTQRDEFSAPPAYNQTSPLYSPQFDQDRNGTPDYYQTQPNPRPRRY